MAWTLGAPCTSHGLTRERAQLNRIWRPWSYLGCSLDTALKNVPHFHPGHTPESVGAYQGT